MLKSISPKFTCILLCILMLCSGCGSSTKTALSPSDTEISSNQQVESSTTATKSAASEGTDDSESLENIETTEPVSSSLEDNHVIENDYPSPAYELVAQINIGWNLGNSFDSCVSNEYRNISGSIAPSFYETAWGNPEVSYEMIDAVKDAGFDTIRIPVTWYYNTYEDEAGKLHIQKAWLNRIKDLVDYCISQDFYVIIDSHHDEEILYADRQHLETIKAHAHDLWYEIALAFQDYEQTLLFEGFNELNDASNSWRITEDYIQINNELNQVFVDTVRSTGNNNSTRILLVGTYLNATNEEVLSGFQLPIDPAEGCLAVSIHCYSKAFNQDIEPIFEALETFSNTLKVPVLLTEFGTQDTYEPVAVRAIHAANYVYRANQHNLKCIWWDDGNSYLLFDRDSQTPVYTDLLEGIMNPAPHETNYTLDLQIDSIEEFSFQSIDETTGSLITSANGSLTYIHEGKGLPVHPNCQYLLQNTCQGTADGIRLHQVAYYNQQEELIQVTSLGDVTSINLSVPSNAAYMKIVLYNPWGYRSFEEYKTMFTSGDLILTLKEW